MPKTDNMGLVRARKTAIPSALRFPIDLRGLGSRTRAHQHAKATAPHRAFSGDAGGRWSPPVVPGGLDIRLRQLLISAVSRAIRPRALPADALSHTVKRGGGGSVVPLRTCSPCPVRRRTVARLVGALVHEQGPPEWGVHVSPARRFQHLVDPSRRTERPETAAAHQRATTPPRAARRTQFH
jgi:hypothetical protein